MLIATAIQNIENGFTPGTLNNGVEKHRVNVQGRYSFTDGALKGFAVTGGVRYRAHKKAASRDPRLKFQTTAPTQAQINEAAYDYLWTPPSYNATIGANYTRRFGRYQARFQINVENLFNEDEPQYDRYAVIQAGAFQGLNTTAAVQNALTVPGGNPRMQVMNFANSNTVHLDPRKFTSTTTFSF